MRSVLSLAQSQFLTCRKPSPKGPNDGRSGQTFPWRTAVRSVILIVFTQQQLPHESSLRFHAALSRRLLAVRGRLSDAPVIKAHVGKFRFLQAKMTFKMTLSRNILPIMLIVVDALVVHGAANSAKDIQRIFSQKCLTCHGPDFQEGGLRLDIEEGVLADLDSGQRAVVPGSVEKSQLIHRVSSQDPDMRMPPPGEGEPLSPQEVQAIRSWIAAGAVGVAICSSV